MHGPLRIAVAVERAPGRGVFTSSTQPTSMMRSTFGSVLVVSVSRTISRVGRPYGTTRPGSIRTRTRRTVAVLLWCPRPHSVREKSMPSDRNIGIIGILIGIFGIVLTIVMYVDTRQSGQITYQIEHETLYRPSKALPTALQLPGVAAPIMSRVTQSIVTIWNGGNVPFKGEDTRTKLTISGDSSVEILAAETQVSKTLPGSSGFSVSHDKGSVVVDWRLFDPGEGLQIALLSTGNAISLDLSGRFLPSQALVRGPIKSWAGSLSTALVFLAGALLVAAYVMVISPAVKRVSNSWVITTPINIVVFLVLAALYLASSYRVLTYAKAYVGDLSPIDPYRIYMDVDRKLDYRYAPM